MRLKHLFSVSLVFLIGLVLLFDTRNVDNDTTLRQELPKELWTYYIGTYGDESENYSRWRLPLNSENENKKPPGSIASPLYPSLGLYSSSDINVMRRHCLEMHEAGIKAVIYHWWSFEGSDPMGLDIQGLSDRNFAQFLKIAAEYSLKTAIQIQPYNQRTSQSLAHDIKGIIKKYANESSYLKVGGRAVIFVYEPSQILDLDLTASIDRYNPYLVATITDHISLGLAVEMGFESVTSFFASDGFTWASTLSNWKKIHTDCLERGVSFIPTVSPGHDETMSGRWSRSSPKARNSGEYFMKMIRGAMGVSPDVILINSFNDYIEATNIEPATHIAEYPLTNESWSSDGDGQHYLMMTKILSIMHRTATK